MNYLPHVYLFSLCLPSFVVSTFRIFHLSVFPGWDISNRWKKKKVTFSHFMHLIIFFCCHLARLYFFFFRGASSWLFSYNVRYFLPNHYFDVIFICSLFVENSSRFRTVITFFYQRAENRFCLTYKYLLFDGYISSSLLCVWVIDNMVCYSINIFMTAVEPMMCWETLIIFQGKQRCSFSWEKILIYERFCFNVFLLEIYFFSVQVLIGHATSTTLTMSAVFSGFEWDP